MDFKAWVELVYIRTDLPFRKNMSRHQEYIKNAIDLVTEARENPSDEIKDKLLSLELIRCDKDSEYVCYARYLKHCINVLRTEGKQK